MGRTVVVTGVLVGLCIFAADAYVPHHLRRAGGQLPPTTSTRSRTRTRWPATIAQADAVDTAPASAFVEATTPLSLSLPELAQRLGGTGRAKMLWHALAQGLDPWVGEAGEVLGAGALRETLRQFAPLPWEVVSVVLADCGTRKILLRMADGAAIETVIIPSYENSRTTVCVSSQVGCNRACSFCATGRMGFLRNLSVDEILAQVYYASRAVRLAEMPPLRNIVFMGMGEPLNNVETVKLALRQMTDPCMFALAPSHISVSTVGPTPKLIKQMVDMPARLAWSVHAATDEMRQILVPTTAHSMTQLRDAFKEVLLKRGNDHLFVEVTMLDGINDSVEHAQALVQLLKELPGKTRVNLLPYNDIGQLSYRPSPPGAIEAFQHVLQAGGLIATVRTSRGAGNAAACGQLATMSTSTRREQCLPQSEAISPAVDTALQAMDAVAQEADAIAQDMDAGP